MVYLVGAGPGDPGLLTRTGQRLLERADSIVYDNLIDRRLLDLAPPRAERLYVGKQAGIHCVAQSVINDLLIRQARLGRQVVRLKGGDPLLFARGAEEALALRDADIPFMIVPGVTAALASAATAGIPLTHRGLSSSVTFVTGHEDPMKEPSVDWAALAQVPGTLVVYMGLTRLDAISDRLIENGKPAATPVTLVSWGGTNRQRKHRLTLDEARRGAPAGFPSPALTIIGEVCGLQSEIDWFGSRPLAGSGVLLLRPDGQNEESTVLLEEQGAVVYSQPMLDVVPIDDSASFEAAFAELPQTDWLVFTSRHGVDLFMERLWGSGRDARALASCRVAAIGPATAEALERHRVRPDCVPEDHCSEGLVAALGTEAAEKRFLLARADRGRSLLPDELARLGGKVSTLVVYRQVDRPDLEPDIADALRDGRIHYVMLTSSNIARGFLAKLDGVTTEHVRQAVNLVSISPITSEVVRSLGHEVAIEATTYTIPGMIAAMTARLAAEASDRCPTSQRVS